MRINHNISGMNAHRLATMGDQRLNSSLEKISTGLRVNRAADDATSLAISEKFKARIGGYRVGIENAQVGISIIQTADQALQSVHELLRRSREMAVRCANDDMTYKDREQFELELVQIKDEINRIVGTTEYNTKNLFLERVYEKSTATAALNVNNPLKSSQTLIDIGAQTDRHPIYSPDGTKIAFDSQDAGVGDYEIWVYDVESQGLTKITDDANQQFTPVWTPDGESLIYSYGEDVGLIRDFAIRKTNVDTGITVNVTAFGAFDQVLVSGPEPQPTMSADGSTILFRGMNPDPAMSFGDLLEFTFPPPAIYARYWEDGPDGTFDLAHADATYSIADFSTSYWAVSAVKTEQTPSDNSVYRLTGEYDTITNLSYDPLLPDRNAPPLIPVDNWPFHNSPITDITISPDGDRAVFALQNTDTGNYHLYSALVTDDHDAFVASLQKLATSTSQLKSPSWSQDNYIVYSASDGDYELYMMKVNSLGIQVEAPVRLTDNAIDDLEGSFHPDGEKIIYRSADTDGGDIIEASLNIDRMQSLRLGRAPSAIDIEVLVNGTALQEDPYDGFSINENYLFFFGDSAPTDGDIVEVKYHPKEVEMILQVGYNDEERIQVSLPTAVTTDRLGINDISVLHIDSAAEAVGLIDTAIETVSTERGELGAQQSRLERTSQELSSRREYLQASETRIRETDMADEAMSLVREQILGASSTRIMIQANSLPEMILQLLT